MDGMIFLRGAFIDSSIKNIVLFMEDTKGKITVVRNVYKLSDVSEMMAENKFTKISIDKVVYDKSTQTAKVYCMLK